MARQPRRLSELRAGFIGAGPRARSGHYPLISLLDQVKLVAVCELDEELGQRTAAEQGVANVYTSHQQMLEREELDLVYCIMGEGYVLEPALDCLRSGHHIMIEKPPGRDSGETRQLLAAAEAANRWAMVGLQRRFSAVTQEALRRVRSRGGTTLAIGTFNKRAPDDNPLTTTLWNDLCHVVDLVRFMAGGEAVEVTAYRDALRGGRDLDHYTALMRFDNGATGCLVGHRASGGRVLGFEVHGIGVGCYARIPEALELHEEGDKQVLDGWDLAGVEEEQVRHYDGQLAMHRHFIDCILTNRQPSTDLRDVVHTAALLDRIEAPERLTSG